MLIPDAPGIYIVTLNNYEPISVNANDPRIADKAIQVTRANCKVGKTKSLARRAASYQKVFGAHNVNFHPIAETVDIETVERAVLENVDAYRIRGPTGRKNEWLHSIDPEQVLGVLMDSLQASGANFTLLSHNLRKT